MARKPQVTRVTLYRGQAKDHAAVLPSGWRAFWLARRSVPDLLALADRYFAGTIDESDVTRGIEAIASVTVAPASMKPRPTLHRFLADACGREMVADLMRDIRDAFGPRWRSRIFHAQLAELETAFFLRYQTFLFNGSPDAFVERNVGASLHRLAQLLFEFYDAHRAAFAVNGRIGQVAADFMGVLQHYGTLDTPGLDLTSDLDVALWFATHRYDDDSRMYQPLPADGWGYVYTADVPIVSWPAAAEGPPPDWPPVRAIRLGDLAPSLLPRIARQHGYYAVLDLSWDRIVDYRDSLAMRTTRVLDHGTAREIERRFERKGLTQAVLFPSRDEDPFKAYLHDQGVETFL